MSNSYITEVKEVSTKIYSVVLLHEIIPIDVKQAKEITKIKT